MENSVDSYINAQPEQALSYRDWFAQNVRDDVDPYNPLFRFGNFVSGTGDYYNNRYKTYLENVDKNNEYIATQSARAWDKYMDDTKIQRLMKDYEKAGLNPYSLVTDSGLSAGSAPTSSKANYRSGSRQNDKDDGSKGRNFALIVLALAKVAAALL